MRHLLGAPFEPMRRSVSEAVSGPPHGSPTQNDDPDISLDMDDSGNVSVFEGSPVRPPTRTALRPVMLSRAHSVATSGEHCSEGTSAPSLPGFGTFEQDHKTLPCHAVKSDGLMRITPETLVGVLQGHYADKIKGFCVVDCRFAYEYEGGHITGATNLNNIDSVRSHFLEPGCGLHAGTDLPCRTQSGTPDESGDQRKFLLIFHCEFSWKRAPTMALALRQADRALAHDYPNCHFPDVYVLEGGYASFFAAYPQLCVPRAYIQMDDPRFLRRRSEELTGFRKQFSRNRSFAYGDGRVASTAAATLANGRLNVRRTLDFLRDEKENAPAEAAPPAPQVARERKLPTRSITFAAAPCTQNQSGMAKLDVPSAARDASFSSAGDSSFDADVGDSPCAVATLRRPLNELNQAAANESSPTKAPFSRAPLQRTETPPTLTYPDFLY